MVGHWWAILLWCSLLPVMEAGAQDASAPCDADPVSQRVADCARILPQDGYILRTTPDGTVGKCACPELRRAPLEKLDSLRAIKFSKVHTRMLAEKRPVVVPEVMDRSRLIYPGPLPPSTLNMLFDGNATCPREHMLVNIVEVLSNMPMVHASQRTPFKFYLINEAHSDGVDEWRSIKLEEHRGIRIVSIPEGLLWSTSVTEELLVFLILHELGHEFRTQPQETEYHADRWAVEEGLPAYYGTDRAAQLLPVIVNALENFMRMEFTPETFHLSSSPPGAIGQYPALPCRLHGILHGYPSALLLPEIHGYPAHCWNNTNDSLPKADRSRPWVRIGCCEEDHAPERLPELRQLMDEELKEWDALSLEGLCKADRRYCDLNPEKAQALFRGQVRKYDRKLHRVEHAQRRTIHRLRTLREAREPTGGASVP